LRKRGFLPFKLRILIPLLATAATVTFLLLASRGPAGPIISFAYHYCTAQTLTFDAGLSSGGEGKSPVLIDVSISNLSFDYEVTVDYAVTGGTATGGGVDYVLADGTLIFPAWQQSKAISIEIVNDVLVEPDETIEITLSNPVGVGQGSPAVHTYPISDDDGVPSAPDGWRRTRPVPGLALIASAGRSLSSLWVLTNWPGSCLRSWAASPVRNSSS